MSEHKHEHKKPKYRVRCYQWVEGRVDCKTHDFDAFDVAVAFITNSAFHFAKIFNEVGEMIHEIVNHFDHDDHGHHHGHHDHYA